MIPKHRRIAIAVHLALGQDFGMERIYRDAAGVSRESNFTPAYVRVGANLEIKL